MRRRLLSILALVALAASACGETVVTLDAPVEEEPIDAATTDDLVGPVDVVEEQPEALRSGREAILANHTEGKPYVLWYWGAH